MSIHTNHRQRVKDRFRNEGLEHFDDLHILELLLFYCVPRLDTNVMAHKLLDRFGSLSNVLEATPEQLHQVEGIGEGVSTFIRFLNELERVLEIRRSQNVRIINSNEDIRDCLKGFMCRHRNEVVYLLCMDAKGKVLCVDKVGEGSVNSANVPVRRIVEMSIACNATSAILAHNHPGGLAFPSPEDVNATNYVSKALRTVDIELVDHVIFADGDYVSLRQSGLYYPGID